MKRPDIECIIVDASFLDKIPAIEYRGIHYPSMKELFRKGPYDGGTNNIAEYIAIVSGMIYSEKHGLMLPVYSDSQTAIKWVKDGKHNTTLVQNEQNEKVFQLLEQAEQWLAGDKRKVSVEKWLTKEWGENPADFGRK